METGVSLISTVIKYTDILGEISIARTTTLMAPTNLPRTDLAYIDDAGFNRHRPRIPRSISFAKYGNRYLYPNGSRMYKLKLVLWEILNGPGLVSGLRMGLATYYPGRI